MGFGGLFYVIAEKVMMKKTILAAAVVFLLASCGSSLTSLVPNRPSKAPDYFSTWNIQGYVVDYHGPNTIKVMDEQHMFGKGKLEGWCEFFPDFREDLIFVMDDSWDIPAGTHEDGDNSKHMSCARLDTTRFPSFKGTPAERLGGLVKKVKGLGWKGLGGWICAKEAESDADSKNPEEYWRKRLVENEKAGVCYWKVDYGRMENDVKWRTMMTKIGRECAPDIMIEHAYTFDAAGNYDAFRTYDVEVITSVPVTLQRVARLLPLKKTAGNLGLVNCEDEPYLAAGLGCAIGVMRHPLNGPLPNGQLDHVFPINGRDLKSRLDEVNRALKWHRIAEPFGVDADANIDTEKLEDAWVLGERETWMPTRHVGDTLREAAPARMSRAMPLPTVEGCESEKPFVLASKYPNGAVAVATLERGILRRTYTPLAKVTIDVADSKSPIGVFGAYDALCIRYAKDLPSKPRVLAQDLKGKTPVDITKEVKIEGRSIVVPGSVINRVGLMAATPGDKSQPGMVMLVK